MKIAVSIGHDKSENSGYDCMHELINYKGDIYLYDRAGYVRRKKFDLCIQFHLNAFNDNANGTETYKDKKQGFADEESMLDFEEKFDSKYGIDDTIKLIEQLMPESNYKQELSDALFTLETWVKANPDKVKALEERLHESVESYIENVKKKINE